MLRPDWEEGSLQGRACYMLNHPEDPERCAVVLQVPANDTHPSYYSALVSVEKRFAENDGLLRSFDELEDAKNWAAVKLLDRRSIWEKVLENIRTWK